MKKLMLLLLCCVFAGMQVLMAQGVTISGKTTDANGEAMPGVTIQVKGTTTGTVSQADGSYKLSVPADATTLVFSFVGMKTQEVAIAGRTAVDVALEEEVTALSEIVVVGYATQTRASLTGSVATVNSQAMEGDASSNAIMRMQGKAAGVNIMNAHTPGGDVNINIRGLGTINNNNPLFVIDGVPTKYGLSQLNPNEIENVTVLKDAASAAIYGARGANGVVIITTKRGQTGKTHVTFSARLGVGNATNQYDLLNTKEFGDLTWQEAAYEGKPVSAYPPSQLYGTGATPDIPDYINPNRASEGDPSTDPSNYVSDPANFTPITRANKEGTDWYKEIYRQAVIQEYNLNLSGGTEKGTYAFTVGYLNEDGILIHTNFDRYSLRSNADAKMNKWLTVGESLGLTYTNKHGNTSDNGEGTPISQAYRMQPIVPVYDIMGAFAGTKGNGTGNGENPVAVLYRDRYDLGSDLRGIGNTYAEITILKDLKFKSLFGFDYRSYNGRDIFMKNPEFTEAKPTDILNTSNNYTLQWNWANTLNYSKTFADVHKLNVLVGSEAVSSQYRYYGAQRTTFYSTDVNYMYLDAGEADQSNNGNGSDVKTMSYFGRVNYSYMDKYLIEATIRRDGSSRFGSNNRWGNFPAASIGWRISEESFMSATKGWLSYLKLRAGYGKSGNDEIGDYNGFTTYFGAPQWTFYGIGGQENSSTSGFAHLALGNPDAKWETTITTDVGFDAAFLNNTLSTTMDFWVRKTQDMLYQLAIPAANGYLQPPSVNIGDMTNKGFDINIDYKNKAMGGDFTYGIGLTISHYKNEITKLSDNAKEFISGANLRQMEYTRATIGTSYPEFFGLIVDGIFQTDAEASAYAPEYGGAYNRAGHYKFRDIAGNADGSPDGKVDDADRTYIGSPHPKFTGGLNIDLGYKNFTFTTFLYASYGNKMMNYVARWIDYSQFNGNRSKDALYDSWTPTNTGARLAAFDADNHSQMPSTAFLEDASFLRCKTMQLAYDLPNSLNTKLGIGNLQVYVLATNLFTATKYRGLDPEVSSSGMSLGIDQGAWPSVRQFMLGVKLDL
jgi:TonB-dependent starch-binding outer membrane protein SusC